MDNLQLMRDMMASNLAMLNQSDISDPIQDSLKSSLEWSLGQLADM